VKQVARKLAEISVDMKKGLGPRTKQTEGSTRSTFQFALALPHSRANQMRDKARITNVALKRAVFVLV
jgi:hypothetical protein